MPRAIRAFALILLSVLLVCSAAAQQRNWHQPYANPAGTSSVDLEGVKLAPAEAWKLEFDKILSEPVVWEGVIFVAVKNGKKSELHAIQAEDGKEIARINLRSADRYWIAVWQNTVSVLAPEYFRSYSLQGNKFKGGKTLRGEFDLRSLLGEQLAFVRQKEGPILVLDAPRGKELASVDAGRGRPAFAEDQLAVMDLRHDEGWYGRRLTLDVWSIRMNGRKCEAVHQNLWTSSNPRKKRGTEESEDTYVVGIARQKEMNRWFVKSPLPLATTLNTNADSALLPGDRMSFISNRPAVWRERIIGFGFDDALISQSPDGEMELILEKDALPEGALRGPLSVAGSSLYLGNWAVDLESQEILWVAADIQPTGPLVPIADGMFAYCSAGNELIACRDDAAALAVNASSGAGGGEDAGNSGGWGATSAAAIAGDYLVHKESLESLHEPVWKMFEKQFDEYLKVRAMEDCRRLLEEASAWDLPADRGRKLAVQMSGKRRVSKGNFEKTLEKLNAKEQQARQSVVQQFIDAAAVMEEAEQILGASTLLADADRLDPSNGHIRDAARSLVPAAFPYAGDSNSTDMWLEWATELMPAGAEFIAADHPLWRRTHGTVWARDTLGLRTENVILLIRSEDPKIVGSCLRNAEGTVRTLNFLLRKDLPEMKRARLQVRVFADRDEYLKVPNSQGFVAMPWSSGYYSPSDRICRFYIPNLDNPLAGEERQFQKTLVHEITHQFLSQRWLPDRTVISGPTDQPGFWIVEGFARFIEDQLMELGQPSMGFNDTRGIALDYSACAADESYFFDPQKLVEFTHRQFSKFSDANLKPLKLKNSLRTLMPSQRTTFYEESGSLVFFMMNRRGEDGRAALIEYMRKFYLGQIDAKGWDLLGFESGEDMETQFRAFLKTVHVR